MTVTFLSKLSCSSHLLTFHLSRPSNNLFRKTTFTRAFRTTPSRMVVHDIEDKVKFEEAIKNNKLVVVDAYATWCGPCRAVAPIIELLSTKHPHAYFVRFDVEKVPDLAQSLEIRAMPTFVFFKDAKKVREVIGANSIEVEKSVVEMA